MLYRFGGAGLPDVKRSQTIQQKYQAKLTRPGLHFLRSLLHMDPGKRLTARECLDHAFFAGLKEVRLQAGVARVLHLRIATTIACAGNANNGASSAARHSA